MVNWEDIKPYDFEKIIGQFYSKTGFTVLVCKPTRDGGVDVFAKKYNPEFGRFYLCAIQAKKWTQKVGIGEVQRLKGVISAGHANVGILITTSDFTDVAYREAMNLVDVELVNKISLERKLADVGLIDVEEIDFDTDSNDQFFQMNIILQVLRGSNCGISQLKELIEKPQIVCSRIKQNAISEMLCKLAKLNRIMLDQDKISYVPFRMEQVEMRLKINTTITSYTFPFDIRFLNAQLSTILNLDPRVIETIFNITEILNKLVKSKQILELGDSVYGTASLIDKMIAAQSNNAGMYDIFDFTSKSLLGSVKSAKEQYYDCFRDVGIAEAQVVNNFNHLASYFERICGKKTLIIFVDFERFLEVDDKRILEVTETLATMPEDNGISLERAGKLLNVNFEPNARLLGSIIQRICSKHHTHVPSHRLKVRENDS